MYLSTKTDLLKFITAFSRQIAEKFFLKTEFMEFTAFNNSGKSFLEITIPVFFSRLSGLPPVSKVKTGVPQDNASRFTVG